jgi:hypothetical protein
MKQVVFNGVICLSCNTLIASYYTHDYKTCNCENKTMVDGGLSYGRYGGVNMDLVEPFIIYSDDKIERIRKFLCRGTEKDGKTEFIPLCKMSEEWIKNVIKYLGENHQWYQEILLRELQYRSTHGIII